MRLTIVFLLLASMVCNASGGEIDLQLQKKLAGNSAQFIDVIIELKENKAQAKSFAGSLQRIDGSGKNQKTTGV